MAKEENIDIGVLKIPIAYSLPFFFFSFQKKQIFLLINTVHRKLHRKVGKGGGGKEGVENMTFLITVFQI